MIKLSQREKALKKHIKNLLWALCIPFFGIVLSANAAPEIASVDFIHKTILTQKNITVPIDTDVSLKNIASLRYLLNQIDRANYILNGFQSSDYASDSASIPTPVTASRATTDIENLIQPIPKFEVTLTNANAFSFQISSSGNFIIDWGDNSEPQSITKSNTTMTTYSYTYSTTGTYTITIAGKATGHSSNHTDAAITFDKSTNKDKITAINGELGKIFPTVNNYSPRFYMAFSGLTGLTELPANMFSGLTGYSNYMFYGVFFRCSGIKSISNDLFAGISGQPSDVAIFTSAFSECTGLTEIPGGLFAGISTTATSLFQSTFNGCTSLTEIPPELFRNLSGPPASSLFSGTFYGCTSLTEIPDGLFNSVSGPPAYAMFNATFYGCKSLKNIPDGLFDNASDGAPANNMFWGTFVNCTSLESIPNGLFAKFNGAPATGMFYNTFYGCSSLTTITAGLFGKFTGAPAPDMFRTTFSNCINITTIENGIWDLSGITNTSATNMFNGTFYNCLNVTSPTPKVSANNNTSLWDKFTTYAGQNAFLGWVNSSEYDDIAVEWGGPLSEPFEITLTNANAFSFQISPSGSFLVDWGDGTATQAINKSNTSYFMYPHTYSKTGTYTVKLRGAVTEYNSDATIPAISFASSINKDKITAINGSLGKIFPTLSSGTDRNPRFYNTFNGCNNLTTIPSGLFGNLSGAPVVNMFYGTFSGCTSLTTIPTNLFGTFTGAPAQSMFDQTFYNCTGLTTIEDGIWDLSNITNTSATNMFNKTFYGCQNITSASPSIKLNSSTNLPMHFTAYQGQQAFGGCENMSDYNTTYPNGLKNYGYWLWPDGVEPP